MFRPRVIPTLLLKNNGLVKSICFKKHRYIGDPINAVRIFNDLKADELVFLDIMASKENRCVSLDFVKNLGDEANMPFAVGGGITTLKQISQIINAGGEKVILNTSAVKHPLFIKEASKEFGSSTIVVSIDVKKNIFGKQVVRIMGGSKSTSYCPIEFAELAEKMGAGEFIINSIDNDGLMNGYDIELVKKVSTAVKIPVIALGGAGNVEHLKQGIELGHASAVAAGSLFIYHGPRKAVLINYPKQKDLSNLFKEYYD